MSISILGGSGYQRGVESAETGGNVESFDVRYFPEVSENLQGIGGETFLTGRSAAYSREVTLNAEIGAATGFMAFTFTTACTLANDIATFGTTTGTLLLDEATEAQSRSSWRNVAEKLYSFPNRVLS